MSRPPTSRSAGSTLRCRRLASLRYSLALVALLLVPSGLAQTLRVTTWNLQPQGFRTNAPGASTNGISIPAAAAALKKLNPDVILLQQVTDWAMCDELAQELKPVDYKVVACSAFREARTGALRKQQVAILAKPRAKAYFSWSEPWRVQGVPALPGGFAFAAFQVGSQRVGLFSVQIGAAPAGPAAKKQSAASPDERLTATVEQLLAQVDSVRNWVTNRVRTFVIGSTFSPPAGQTIALQDTPLQMVQDAGFGDVFQDTPALERATVRGRLAQARPVADYLLTQPAGCATNPIVLRAAVSRRFPVTCDVTLGPPAAAAVPTARVEPAAALKPPAPNLNPQLALDRPTGAAGERALGSSQPPTLNPQLVWLAAGVAGVLAVAVIVWMLVMRGKVLAPPTPPLLTAGGDTPSGYTVVLTSQSATESTSPDHRSAPPSRPLIQIETETPGTTQTQTEALQQRALAAEQRAERANAVIRARLIPHLGHWLKQKLVRKLIADRTQMLKTQQAATLQAMAVEQRLARIEQQIQQQNQSYQDRIEELTRELLVAKEENRELIRARISQVKAEMAAARARLMAQSQPDRDPGS